MTFADLMRCNNDNKRVYDNLLQQMRDNCVTPFIGCGLSLWAGYPTWRNLLLNMAGSISKKFKNDIKAILDGTDEDRYEIAASLVKKELGQNAFEGHINREVDINKTTVNAAECPQYQLLLPKLFTKIWATTNFDHVIEYLFGTAKKTIDHVTPLNNYNDDIINHAMQEQKSLLLKLHGDIEDIHHLVLTKESYDDAYADGKPMPQTLKKVFERNPVLFLGCSLSQDRTMSELKKCCVNNPQFAVLQLPEATLNEEDFFTPDYFDEQEEEKPEWRERRLSLSNKNIGCIWYPATNDEYKGNIHNDALNVLINHLAKDLGISPNSGSDGPSISLESILNAVPVNDIFLFRDKEIQTLEGYLKESGVTCVVTGEPGIGKTQLCLHVRNRSKLIDDGKYPCVLVEGANGLSVFFSRIAESIHEDLPEGCGYEDAGVFILKRLLQKQVKIVYFDNFEDILYALEHNSGEREFLWKWINAVNRSGISCLISGREEINIHEINMRTLRLEDIKDDKQRKELFIRYLGREPAESEKSAFDQLTQSLNGHPLAIALTAMQAREIPSLNELLDIWQKVEQPAITNRHQSLANACKVTWKHLQDKGIALQVWGVFAFCTGHIDTQVLTQMDTAAGGNDYLWGIESCIRSGVLRANAERTALEMCVPIKEQFFNLADDKQKSESVKIWFEILDPISKAILDRATHESYLEGHISMLKLLPNCLSMLEHLCNNGMIGEIIKLDDMLFNYYSFSLSSGQVLEKLTGIYKTAEDKWHLAYTLYSRAELLSTDPSTAKKLYAEAERLFREQKDNLGLANTLRSRADLARRTDPALAEKLYAEAEELYREQKDNLGLANTLRSRADLANRTDPALAEKLYAEAEEIYREQKDNLGLANTLRSRADLANRTDPALAEKLYAEAEEIYREQKANLGLANTLMSRADLASRTDPALAEKLYAEAEELYREQKDNLGLANTLKSRADLARRTDPALAEKLYAEAEELYREQKDNLGLANTLKSRADMIKTNSSTRDELIKAKDLYLLARQLYTDVRGMIGGAYTDSELYETYTLLGMSREADEVKEQLMSQVDKLPSQVAIYVLMKIMKK